MCVRATLGIHMDGRAKSWGLYGNQDGFCLYCYLRTYRNHRGFRDSLRGLFLPQYYIPQVSLVDVASCFLLLADISKLPACVLMYPFYKTLLSIYYYICWSPETGCVLRCSNVLISFILKDEIYFFLNNQPDALIIQIYSVIKLYMIRGSSLSIIRSFPLYIRHW